MAGCEIDYCESPSAETLTIELDDQIITLQFCRACATALQARLADQLGTDPSFVDLRGGKFRGKIGQLQAALAYLDGPQYVPQSAFTA